MSVELSLTLLHGSFAVVQMPPDHAVPTWIPTVGFVSVTRTVAELSVVCLADSVPPDLDARIEPGWRLLRFEGPFEFSLTGVLASVLDPLAAAAVGIFALSTFDTDYVLVKESDLATATAALTSVGHSLSTDAT